MVAAETASHRKRNLKRGLALAALALGALGADFLLFPDLFEDRIIAEAVSRDALENGAIVSLGQYRVHSISVSYGRIEDKSYMDRLSPRVNGIAMTAFSTVGSDKLSLGSLGTSVLRELPSAQAEKVRSLIEGSPEFTPGRSQPVRLEETRSQGPLSRMKAVFVMRAKRGNDSDAKSALKDGLTEMLQQTDQYSVSGLLLPTLTVAPGEVGSPTFDDFFGALFAALRASKTPRYVDISFFEGWPKGTLKKATAAINSHWAAHAQQPRGFLRSLHRFQFRILLVGLAVCFLVSSAKLTLDAKSAVILGASYTGMVLAAFKTVDEMPLEIGVKNFLYLAGAIGIAILFLWIATWDIKALLRKGGKDA